MNKDACALVEDILVGMCCSTTKLAQLSTHSKDLSDLFGPGDDGSLQHVNAVSVGDGLFAFRVHKHAVFEAQARLLHFEHC